MYLQFLDSPHYIAKRTMNFNRYFYLFFDFMLETVAYPYPKKINLSNISI